MKKIFILLLLLSHLPLHAQYSGNVYIDASDSSAPNSTNKPIEGVVVTDGLNVVKTDKKGHFSLPGFEKTHFISITTPAGFESECFYLPIEKDRKTYDFFLTESLRTRSASHSFIQITDTEVMEGLGRWVTDLKQYIINEQPSFLIHTGDICYEAGLRMHNKIVNSQTMGCPVYYCIGNHDLVEGKYGEELYESLYGPVWYSFDVGNIHYVVTPIDHGDRPTEYTQIDVYNWLKNDLSMMKRGQSLVLFNHDLFTPEDTFVFKADEAHTINLRKYRTKAQIYGHMHYNYVRNQNGIYTICTTPVNKGGIDHSASSFRIISIGPDNEIATRLRYAFVDPHVTIVSPLEHQDGVKGSDGKLLISVNTYYSQASTAQVTYRLKTIEEHQKIAEGVLTPNTDWNWSAKLELPIILEGKKMELTVISRFKNGQVAVSQRTFSYSNRTKQQFASGENWNTLLQNSAHTGGLNCSNITLPLQQQWTTNIGGNIFMVSPIIAEGKVFVASIDDNAPTCSHICAYDFDSGELLWKFKTENSIKNTMAYEGGIIVAQDASCHLYAINAQTGDLLWNQYINLKGYPYLTEGLTIDKGIVYAGVGAGLSAWDLKTGQTVWTNKDWKQREGSTTTLTVAGNTLVSGTQWGGLYGNDIHTGRQLWKLVDNGLSNRGASPVYCDGLLWIISSKSVFTIDPKEGKVINHKELPANLDVTSTPLVTEHEIIFGTAEGGILSLDRKTLFAKWKMETHPSLVYTAPYTTTPLAGVETSPVASGEIVFIGTSDGYFYAIDKTTGIIRDTFNLGAPIFSTVAVSGNKMVVCDFAGNIYCFASTSNSNSSQKTHENL